MKFTALIASLLLCAYSALAADTPAPAVTPKPPKPPVLAATSFILLDFNTGTVLSEKDSDLQVEPASLTKLMTAYVVFNELKNKHLNLSDTVRISENAWRTQGSRMYVKVNSEVTVEDLLRGMIVQSGNDASVALAEHVAGSEDAFATMMNQYAKRLGLSKTHYQNSTGMPGDNHISSARDMATMAVAIIRDFPEYYSLYSEKEFTYNKIEQSNRNLLLWRDQSVDGMKTGYTKAAGYCLVSSAKRKQMRLISVVMGTDSKKARANESQKILNYGFRFYESHKAYEAGQQVATTRVWHGSSQDLLLTVPEPLYVTIPRGQFPSLRFQSKINPQIQAPLEKGQTVGKVQVLSGDKLIAEQDLVTMQAVTEGSFLQQSLDYLILKFQELALF